MAMFDRSNLAIKLENRKTAYRQVVTFMHYLVQIFRRNVLQEGSLKHHWFVWLVADDCYV